VVARSPHRRPSSRYARHVQGLGVSRARCSPARQAARPQVRWPSRASLPHTGQRGQSRGYNRHALIRRSSAMRSHRPAKRLSGCFWECGYVLPHGILLECAWCLLCTLISMSRQSRGLPSLSALPGLFRPKVLIQHLLRRPRARLGERRKRQTGFETRCLAAMAILLSEQLRNLTT